MVNPGNVSGKSVKTLYFKQYLWFYMEKKDFCLERKEYCGNIGKDYKAPWRN